VAIAGFQFNVSGPAVLSASGGAAADAGFTVSTSPSVVIGFAFDGSTIPAGSGVLTTLVVQGDPSGFSISGEVVSSSDGVTLDSFIEDNGLVYCSADADADGVCDGLDDCIGALDDCGVCNGGNASMDECGVCDGGNASMDDCGVCDGNGTSCLASLSLGAFDSSGSLEVLYDFGGPVAGFQFDVTGLALTGGSGGAAGDAGMTVSTGGATVLGFSFDNSDFVFELDNCILINIGQLLKSTYSQYGYVLMLYHRT
jgi:hypothetical protein